MSFLGSIFGGQDKNLNTAIGQTSQLGGNLTSQGQNYTNQAGTFWSSILSGDASKQAQALAPEISAAKTSAAQTNKTNALFGGRSGGTAASAAATDDKTHANITNLIGSLTNSSASSLASLGSNLLSTGLGAINDSAKLSEDRLSNWQNSIFGGALTGGAGIGLKALSNWAVPGQS